MNEQNLIRRFRASRFLQGADAGCIDRMRAHRAAAPVAAALLAAALAISTGAARASEPRINIEACQAGHFERDRYRDDLQAEGWQTIAEDQREAAIAQLADAFLPLVLTADYDDRDAWRAESLAVFQAEAEGRLIMAQPGAVLLMAGLGADDGSLRVDCWVALQDGTLVDALIHAAETPDGMDPANPGYAVYGPNELEPGRELTLVASRHPPLPGQSLAASHGLLSRTDLMTSDRGQNQ